jgi:hypothetical protein
MFQTLSPGIFFFSSRRKKKNKQKKTIEKKKMQRREGGSLQAFALPFHFWLPFLPSCFYLFASNTFSSSSFSSQAEIKNTKKKKPIEKKKKWRKGREFNLFSFASIFGMKRSSCFLLSTFLQC